MKSRIGLSDRVQPWAMLTDLVRGVAAYFTLFSGDGLSCLR